MLVVSSDVTEARHHLPGVDRILDTMARLQWDDQPDTAHLAATR